MKYVFISQQPGKVNFSPLSDVLSTLSFSNRQTNAVSAFDKTKSVRILRNTMVLSTPKRVNAPGCTDVCNAIDVALSTRIEISGPLESAADVKAHMLETIRVLTLAVEDPSTPLLGGWLPTISANFEA